MKVIFYIHLLLMSLLSYGQSITLDLWEDQVPNALDSDIEEMVEVTESRRVSKVVNPTIEVFLPAGSHAVGKAVVICPGGGYARLAYDKEGTDIAKYLNGHGVAGIVLKYRLPDEGSNQEPHRSPLMDVKKAIELTRDHAEEWGISADAVGVMGFSAGGHLASTLGTHFEQVNRPDFMILLYPVISMSREITHMGSRTNLIGTHPDENLIAYFSNELQVTADTPPTFMVHSEDDRAVPIENSLLFYQSLKDKGVSAEFHAYPYGGHGYGLAIGKGRLAGWSRLMIEWLRELDD